MGKITLRRKSYFAQFAVRTIFHGASPENAIVFWMIVAPVRWDFSLIW
jgi:hypothetical protein